MAASERFLSLYKITLLFFSHFHENKFDILFRMSPQQITSMKLQTLFPEKRRYCKPNKVSCC